MAKLPYMQFYTGDWLKDPNLQKCSHKTKGVWIDLLCLMWESNPRGSISGTYEQIARLVRISEEEFREVANELTLTETANITSANNTITILSRRINRDEKARESNRSRQSKYRGNTKVTVVSHQNNRDISETETDTEEKDKSFSSDVVELSEYFLDKCHKKIKRESININSWNDAIEKMNRIDLRPFKEIKEVFNFIFTDQFWSNQAVGPISLRKKNSDGIMRYDVVLAKMNQTSGVSGDNPPERHLPSDIKI